MDNGMDTTLEVLRMAGVRINRDLDDAVEGNVEAYGRILTSLAVIRITIAKAKAKEKEAEKYAEADKDGSALNADE